MDTLIQDIRFALRSLRRAKGYTTVMITVMALGIGVNVTVFALVYGILFRPWPLPHQERIVVVNMTEPRRHFKNMGFSWQNYFDLRDRSKSFEHLGLNWDNTAMVTLGHDPERLSAGVLTSDVLPALGVMPVKGRNFTRDEEIWGHNWTQIMISDRIWRDRFHSDPNILGQTIRMNGRVRQVIAILPPRFRYPETADFWIPAGFNAADDKRTDTGLQVVGRLKPGVTVEQADAEVKNIMGQLRSEHPELKEYSARVTQIQKHEADNDRPFVLFLLFAVIFVLMIACANVANLGLVRAAGRRREIGLRLALGATRGRIVRQLLTESVMISAAGGALGILLGYWGNKLWQLGVPLEFPFTFNFAIDAPVLLYTAAITVTAGIIFGLAPALHAAGENFIEALREGTSQAGTSRAGRRMRNVFVVAEVSLSLVLLAGAGLMVRSLQRVTADGERLRPDGAVTGQLLLPIASYPDENALRRFLREFVRRLESEPGVHQVAGATMLPYARNSNELVVMTPETGEQKNGVVSHESAILPGTMKLLNLKLLEGREFSPQDDEHSPRVAILSTSLAKKLFPGRDALGQKIKFVGQADSVGWRTVVGVSEDVLMNVEDSEVIPYIAWVDEYQETSQFLQILVRADGDGSGGAATLRRVMRSMDPNLPIMQLRTLREELRFALWIKRLLASIIGVLAVLAFIIAGVGLYGVVAYGVAQRTREIGIRMALGADARNVVRMVVTQSAQLTLAGLVLGLLSAFALTRFMSAVIIGVSPTDPPTFMIVSALLALSGIAAAWVPALRAARVDPMVALRCD
ncbi:MAG TPA: ABC transporter permease [Candidatus Udaeobacter sp.]|jgi:putative ABC transport system permease protein|nr:ABC transporter permease [Candidatus Udaeobacter sp.]